jgi:hypothetical protein
VNNNSISAIQPGLWQPLQQKRRENDTIALWSALGWHLQSEVMEHGFSTRNEQEGIFLMDVGDTFLEIMR